MQSWNVPKVQRVLSEDFRCDFKSQWNTPHASRQGEIVETLIKSVRQGLNAMCKNQAFTEEQLRTKRKSNHVTRFSNNSKPCKVIVKKKN